MKNQDQIKVAILGDTAAGKTCFIAVLQWLGDAGELFENVGANGESKSYLDRLFQLINNGELPAGSEETRVLSFSEVYAPKKRKRTVFNFEMRDYRGADLKKIEDTSSLFQCWATCDVLLVMIDVSKIMVDGSNLRDNLRDLRSVLTRPLMCPRDKRLAIVLTQADKAGFTTDRHSMSDARAFIEEKIHGFIQTIDRMGFRKWQCFALASLGIEPPKRENGIGYIPMSCDTNRPMIKPFGYEELFDWLSEIQPQISLKRMKADLLAKWHPLDKPVKICLLSVGCVVAMIFAVLTYQWSTAAATASDSSEKMEVRAKATWDMREEDRIREIETRIQNYAESLRTASAEADIRTIIKDWEPYWRSAKLVENQKKRIDELRTDFKHQLEDALVKQITDAVDINENAHARELIARYDGDDLILRYQENVILDARRKLKQRERKSMKDDIAKFDVGNTSDTSRMRMKIDMVRRYDYPNEQDQNDAYRAAMVMNKLLDTNLFQIRQIQVGTLEGERKIYVKIATGVQNGCDLKDNDDALSTTQKKGVTEQWDETEIKNSKVEWKPGVPIRVEWRRNRLFGRDKAYASYECHTGDWLGMLRMLEPKCRMKSCSEKHKNFANEGAWMTIKCDEFESPEKDIELIEKFIVPGTYWMQEM